MKSFLLFFVIVAVSCFGFANAQEEDVPAAVVTNNASVQGTVTADVVMLPPGTDLIQGAYAPRMKTSAIRPRYSKSEVDSGPIVFIGDQLLDGKVFRCIVDKKQAMHSVVWKHSNGAG